MSLVMTLATGRRQHPLDRPAGLLGGSIHVAGLERTLTDVLVRLNTRDGHVQSELLRPGRGPVLLSGERSTLPGYLTLGVEHLLFGFDHLLFIVNVGVG